MEKKLKELQKEDSKLTQAERESLTKSKSVEKDIEKQMKELKKLKQ